MGTDNRHFYSQLFRPLEEKLGKLDEDTLMPLVGFDAGGPLSLCTIGRNRGDKCVTYVSCELAVRQDQRRGKCGPYEVLMICDSERWARSVLTEVGRMSLEASFQDGHTLDIGAWVGEDCPLQGVVFEQVVCVKIDNQPHAILRCHGVTRLEMEYAIKAGAANLYQRLKKAGV